VQESTKPEVGTLHASGKKGDAVSGQGIMAGVSKRQSFESNHVLDPALLIFEDACIPLASEPHLLNILDSRWSLLALFRCLFPIFLT